MDWDDLREREFPVARRWAYLDHAAVSPLPRCAVEALMTWSNDVLHHGAVNWPAWERKVDVTRERMARLINADPDEIVFTPSTTHGIGLVAEGFPWRTGDNVVSTEDEFPSNIYPWMNLASRGVALRRIPAREDGRILVDDLAAAFDYRTRLLAISHVEFASGFRNDLDRLAELCHSRDAALFVDAIQGIGPHTIDVRKTPIDFLAADGHKWLLGPEGAGFLYIRRDWIERLRPIMVGWHSVARPHDHSRIDFTLKPNAQRWEGGSYVMPGLQALGASLELLMGIGPELVSARILDRAEGVRERALARGWEVFGSEDPAERSAIVSLRRPGTDHAEFARRLKERGIAASCRGGRIRISAHVYNGEDDLDRLAEALADR